MPPGKSEILAREREWGTRAGIAALAGAVLVIVGFIIRQGAIGGETNYEGLIEAHDNASAVWQSGIATAIGYALLIAPTLFLFRAVQARSDKVRNQFSGLAILGPLLLAVAGIVISVGTVEAANTYVDGKSESTLTPKEAASDCREASKDSSAKEFADDFATDERPDPQEACVFQKTEEDRASNAIKDSSMLTFGQFAGLGGGLAFVVSLFYGCLWAMRTGILTRFWGSLGMAVGVAALIGFSPLAMLWFAYFGLLLLGRVPGGRPPAWEAGEAIPWPTPGEAAAEELAGTDGPGAEDPAGDPPRLGEAADPGPRNPGEGKRKRKKRD